MRLPDTPTYLEAHDPMAVIEILDLAAETVRMEFVRANDAGEVPPGAYWPKWWKP